MFWLFRAARRLREFGILGMNRRNAACILDHNQRSLYPIVDDKLRMRDLCDRIGVPSPKVFASVGYHSELRRLSRSLAFRHTRSSNTLSSSSWLGYSCATNHSASS